MGLLEIATNKCSKCAFRNACFLDIGIKAGLSALHEKLPKDVCLFEAYSCSTRKLDKLKEAYTDYAELVLSKTEVAKLKEKINKKFMHE